VIFGLSYIDLIFRFWGFFPKIKFSIFYLKLSGNSNTSQKESIKLEIKKFILRHEYIL